MTTPCSTATNHNFNCVIKASLELINLPLIDILANHVKDVDLFNKIDSCPTLLSGRYQLRSDQLKICYLKPPAIPDYRQFDVTLLYKLIRNLCPLLRPTQGWGNEPQPTDTQLGDDIERLRLFRNTYYAHAVSKTIPDTKFDILWKDLKSVIRRIQSKCQTVCSVSYEQELIAIENSKFTHGYLKKCEVLLEAFLKLQTDERDEPEVVIKGKDEVLCGDLARFVAVLKPDSSCWSITWQKRKGKVIETIDTSTKKYSGSTNRKLVIQSVCKEDEGEYQVELSHKSNGDKYSKRGNTICLHVFGEVPYLNDLRVTTGDEGIIIHYEVSGQSPEVQRIEWKKDGQVLNTNACKYIGGSINDSSLTIRLPTEEDKGKYSCIITNAVGSVSKDVMLDVPSVDIEVNPTVFFGSNATITAVVSSTPPPEQVIWQKSKDGNNFHCIDIRKPNYYGSNDIPFKPLLVIPKATFDDKLNYRLLVRNKIRESISETVHLNVTGSPPNIMTSQETNIKCKLLKLIGNVSLYDDSPDILEVFWTKNGKKIDTWGSGGRLSEVTIDNPSLIIRDVNVDDAGNYQLTAVNAVGSTTSDVIALDVPDVFFEKTENKEDGTQMYLVTIQSVPSPCSVQWSSKGTDEDVYTAVDVNEEEYKGTLNTLPHPVLVVEKNKLKNYNYQIKVTNFIGCTVKQISDNQHHPTENITKENKIYKDRDAGIKFAKLSNYLAKHFPHQELHNLKLMLLASEKIENVSALMSAKSASECFTILHEENLFTQKDVIFMQFLCKETGCDELYSQCIKYALTNKALCYFEKPPDNGYKNVQFHVQGNLNDYTKEQIEHIVEVVADILDCETQEISVNGVKPSNSFFLVLSLKEVYTWKLSKMNEQDCHRLMDLKIDFFIVDFNTIFLQSVEGRSPIGTPKNDKPNFPKCRRLQTFTAFRSNSKLSTQKEGRGLETEIDNKDKIILDLNSPLGKRGNTKRDEKCQFSIDVDQPQDKPFTSSDVQHLNTVSCSRSQSISPLVENRVVSAETESCYNRDGKKIIKTNEVNSYGNRTSAMVRYDLRLKRENLLSASNSNEISHPSEGQYRTSLAKGKRHFYPRHQSSQIVSGHSFGKSLMYSNIDSGQIQKEGEHEQMRGHQPQSVDLHNNGRISKDNVKMNEKRPPKRYCEESLEFLNAQLKKKRRLGECSTRDDLIIESCPARNCVHCQRRENSLQTDSKEKLNSLAVLQRQQQSSSVQAHQGWWNTRPEIGSNVFKLNKRKKAMKQNYTETFQLDKIVRPKRYSDWKHRKPDDQKGQFTVDIYQSKAKTFPSSDVQHLDTESFLKSPSISPFAGSRVDSAEVDILYKGDDKDPTVEKPHVHETSAMVSDQMRLDEQEMLRFASNLNKISHPSEGQYRKSLAKGKHHLYPRHQSSQIVSGHSFGKSLMYLNIDSGQIQKEREHEQMRGHQPKSVDLHNTDHVSKDNAILQEERLPKRYCEESLEFPNTQFRTNRRLVECSTHDLITDSCAAKNCVHSQRRDNSLQTDSEGKLNSSAVLQRQQQSSSIQADRGWWNTRLETDSHVFKLDEEEKVMKKHHTEAFRLGKIVKPNRYSHLKDRKSIAQKGQFSVDIDQSKAKSLTRGDVHYLDTVSLSALSSISPFGGNRVDSTKVEILYNRDEKNPIVKKPYIHETSEMISDNIRLKREHLLMCSDINRCLILKNTKQEQMIRHPPQSEDLHNNDSVPKDNAKLQEERLPKGYCEESLEFQSEKSEIKGQLVECSTHDFITDSCPARNCVHSQRSDNPFQTERKGELNPAAVLQRQQSSPRQTDRGWWNTRLETDSQLFKLNKDEKAKKRKHEEAFGLERIIKTKRTFVDQKCHCNVDKDQSEENPFTSSEVQHLNTWTFSRTPSLSTLLGSRSISAGAKVIHNHDDKRFLKNNKLKQYGHENFAMVDDKMLITRKLIFGASNTHPLGWHYQKGRGHFYSRHQAPPQSVSEHALGLIYSNIDSCQIQKEREHIQMRGHQPQSEDLHNNDSAPKDNAKLQEERFSKGYCEESLEFQSEHSKIKRRQVECSTHDLITDFCPARNCVYSHRSNNPLQTERKGELNPAAVLQRQQQSSSRQADRGWWNTPLEIDSQLFKLNNDEKAKKRKHEEAFGLERIIKTERQRKSVDQKCQNSVDKDQSEENPFTISDVQHLNTVSYSRSQSTSPLVGSRVDSAEVEILYNRDDVKKPSKY